VTVIAGYALMTDAELGLSTFIKHDGNARYIIARDMKISIEDRPIASTKAIVCRGTTCYRGRGIDPAPEHVVKFAWPSDKRQREGRLLKLAKERGVTGIAEWVHDEQVSIDGVLDTIANLRRGMEFGDPRRLSSKALWVDSPTGSSRANSRTRSSLQLRSRSSIGRLRGLGIPTSSASNSSAGQKRTRDDGSATEGGAMKRSKSNDSQAAVADPASDLKERGQAASNFQSIEEPEDDSLAGGESETYGNRVHTCLVTSPAGRPLQSFRSVRELLEAIRDAISAHRSLLEDGKILHRDISENNIIITTPFVEGEPKGRLVDLDLGKELNSAPSGASHRTGTMQFMAIEVLQGKGHTYRHDLESFFYVLIWMCIRYGHDNPSDLVEAAGSSESKPNRRKGRPAKTSILRGWYTGTYAEIANTKRGHMVGFEEITAEFAPRFHSLKNLAGELRNVLFPIRGSLFTGTYKDRNIMYDGMITAFDKAIGSLEHS
jgi:hypothetical protein